MSGLIGIVTTVIGTVIGYIVFCGAQYVICFPWSFSSKTAWFCFLVSACIRYCARKFIDGRRNIIGSTIGLVILCIAAAIYGFYGLTSSPLINPEIFAGRIEVGEGDFDKD